jgi:branched-chain amino acid transport system substrate-binding protein
MSISPRFSFGEVLRRNRLAAGLSQEDLAERAHLSREAISALERGNRRAPRKETINLLAEALALTEAERATFDAAARQHRVANKQASALPTPADAPDDLQIESPETAHPSEDGPTLSSHQPPLQVAHAPHLRASLFGHGKWAVTLVSGLVMFALLFGALFFTGKPGVKTAGQHPRTLCIASDFPTTGFQASLGKPAENAVQLAVMQNRDLGDGYTLKFIPYNDAPASGESTDPRRGASNMTDMVQTPCIVGMVGPLNSSDAQAEMPIAAHAGLVMISPATTNPGLTERKYAQLDGYNFDTLHPAGKKTNFFSISPNDAIQGFVDADFAFDALQARGVYVIEDHGSYGEGMAGGFTQGFLLRGGTIVGNDYIPYGGIERIAELVGQIVATRPDAVFYGGTTDGGGALLLAQLVKAGYKGPFVGGDAIARNPAFVQQAGVVADYTLFASLAAPDLTTFTTGAAAQFLRNYHTQYPGQGLDGYSANAYDAAMVLITGMKHLIKAGREVTRDTLIDQIQNINYRGVTGPVSFDKNGDIAHGIYSIYTVQAGQWAYFQQVTI